MDAGLEQVKVVGCRKPVPVFRSHKDKRSSSESVGSILIKLDNERGLSVRKLLDSFQNKHHSSVYSTVGQRFERLRYGMESY